jgi:hypothetical protein
MPNEKETGKKKYVPPQLTIHGTVEKITAGGAETGDIPSGGLLPQTETGMGPV